jgi:hypothetical protein
MKLLAALILVVGALSPALANPTPSVETTWVDALGIEWVYSEDVDAIDDRRQVTAYGALPARTPAGGAAIGMICVEGWGPKARLDVPEWNVPQNERRLLQGRVDQGAAFDVEVVGTPIATTLVDVVYSRGGRELLDGLRTARERIAIRGPNDRVILFPMTTERPEIARAWARCREFHPRR